MKIQITPTFQRALKKLHPPQKRLLDEAVRRIAQDPIIGEAKLGDLSGVRVYKFKMNQQVCLLAYRVIAEQEIKLLTFGSHENFYRDLKSTGL